MSYATRVNNFLQRLDRPRFVLLVVVADYLARTAIVLPLAQVVRVTGATQQSMEALGFSPVDVYFITLVVAPVFETWLGQVLPFSVLYRFRVNHPVWLIGVSATWFALSHGPSVATFIPVFPSSVILAYTFWRWRQVDLTHAFWMTAAVHASVNLVATILELVI